MLTRRRGSNGAKHPPPCPVEQPTTAARNKHPTSPAPSPPPPPPTGPAGDRRQWGSQSRPAAAARWPATWPPLQGAGAREQPPQMACRQLAWAAAAGCKARQGIPLPAMPPHTAGAQPRQQPGAVVHSKAQRAIAGDRLTLVGCPQRQVHHQARLGLLLELDLLRLWARN